MLLCIQTRLQTADQTLFSLYQTQSDADRAVQPRLLCKAAISSNEPVPNRKIAASSAVCCIS